MEVDLNPSSSPVDSRHSSPFRMNLSTSASTSLASMGGQMSIDKKRRRSLQQLSGPPSPSIDYDISGSSAGEQQERDGEKEGAGPSKRRHVHHAKNNNTEPLFRALGSAYNSGSFSLDQEYGVDSTMYSLSLASPCPSPPTDVVETSPHSDTDMGDDNISTSASYNDKTSSSVFVPRQLKQTSLFRIGLPSTVPLRPSPLVHSERFQSSFSQTSSSFTNNDSSRSTSSFDSSPQKLDTALLLDGQSSSCNSSPGQIAASISQHHSIKFANGTRTPSPSPIPINSSSDNEADGRKTNYSPGLSQASFPGGKHMLRYTMGYREDCTSCKSKTPGHYGHVMHR